MSLRAIANNAGGSLYGTGRKCAACGRHASGRLGPGNGRGPDAEVPCGGGPAPSPASK